MARPAAALRRKNLLTAWGMFIAVCALAASVFIWQFSRPHPFQGAASHEQNL